MRTITFAVAVVSLGRCSTVFAQTVGDTVIVIDDGAKLMSGSTVVGEVQTVDPKVLQVNGEWFWVNSMGTKGWIHRRHVALPDRAMQIFTQRIRTGSGTARDHYLRGAAWLAKGEYDIALADFNESIRLDPGFAGRYHARGGVWGKKGDYDKAVADYDQAIRLDPKKARYYNDRAWLYATCTDARHRNGDQAVKDATTACNLSNWKYEIHIDTLAAAYAESGDFTNAVKWQQKALDIAHESQKDDYRSRLNLYKSGKPYRQEPK